MMTRVTVLILAAYLHIILRHCQCQNVQPTVKMINNNTAVEFRCARPSLLAPGSKTGALGGAIPFVERLYSLCLGVDRCYLGSSTIKAILGNTLENISDLTNDTSSLPSKLLNCVPDYIFHVIGSNTMFTVAPNRHFGYILTPRGRRQRLNSILTFLYSERREIILNIYYMYGKLTIGVEVGTSHTISYCIPINQGETTRVVKGVTSNMTLAVTSCANDGRFIIGFSVERGEFDTDLLRLRSHVGSSDITECRRQTPKCGTTTQTPRSDKTQTPQSDMTPFDDSQKSAAVSSREGAVIGGSIGGGLLLASIIVFIAMCVLWRSFRKEFTSQQTSTPYSINGTGGTTIRSARQFENAMSPAGIPSVNVYPEDGLSSQATPAAQYEEVVSPPYEPLKANRKGPPYQNLTH